MKLKDRLYARLKRAFHWKYCTHGLQIVDFDENSGNFVIYCKFCGTGWIAECVVEGFGFRMTKSAMSRGCKECRSYVYNEVKHASPAIHYHCPQCEEVWDFKVSTEPAESQKP